MMHLWIVLDYSTGTVTFDQSELSEYDTDHDTSNCEWMSISRAELKDIAKKAIDKLEELPNDDCD